MTILRAALAVVLAVTASSGWAAPAGVTLIGKGAIAGTALDKSGLTGSICQAGAPTNVSGKAAHGSRAS